MFLEPIGQVNRQKIDVVTVQLLENGGVNTTIQIPTTTRDLLVGRSSIELISVFLCFNVICVLFTYPKGMSFAQKGTCTESFT